MQNRFITFDERLMPGPQFDGEGLFFDQQSYHNIPGYLDNVMVSACMLFLTARLQPEDLRDDCLWPSAYVIAASDLAMQRLHLQSFGLPVMIYCSRHCQDAVHCLAVGSGPICRWLQGAKSRFYDIMARANSSADPDDILVNLFLFLKMLHLAKCC